MQKKVPLPVEEAGCRPNSGSLDPHGFTAQQHLDRFIRFSTAHIRHQPCRGVHGNGEDWDPMGPMGMGIRSAMGWELSAWEWELRRGVGIVFCSYIVTWSKGSNAGGATA